MCSIRITSFVSNISSKSILKVIKQIVKGETNPDILVGSLHIRIVNKNKKEVIKQGLIGFLKRTSSFCIRAILWRISNDSNANRKMFGKNGVIV